MRHEYDTVGTVHLFSSNFNETKHFDTIHCILCQKPNVEPSPTSGSHDISHQCCKIGYFQNVSPARICLGDLAE